MNLISLEFKRVIKSKIFLGVLLFNIIFYFYVNYNMNNIYFISYRNFYMRLFFLSPDMITSMNTFYFLLPILAALVGSDILGQDIRSKEYINILTRTPRHRVFLVKLLMSFISAGLVMISVFILDVLVKLAIFPINMPSVFLGANFQYKMGMSDLLVYHPMIYTIVSLLFTFAFSGLMGIVGFTMSLFLNKKLVVVSTPFIINMLIWNMVNILNIKDYSVSSMLIFRITHNRYTIVELLLAFFVPLILSLIIILIKEKKYDYI